jgi:hypothetical protein
MRTIFTKRRVDRPEKQERRNARRNKNVQRAAFI